MGWIHDIRSSRLPVRLAVVLCLSLVCLIYLLPGPAWIRRAQPHLSHGTGHDEDQSEIQTSPVADNVRPIPSALGWEPSGPQPTGFCAERFGTEYLHGFSKLPTNYCDANSTARFICFSYKASDQRTDSFCIGGPSVLHAGEKAFKLDCVVRNLDREETAQGVPQLHSFPAYWYNTGPHAIMRDHVKLDRFQEPALDAESHGISFMIRRENNNQNFWHTMMEIMSLTYSLDILRSTVDPSTQKPFVTDRALEDSRVVFLDDLADGPFYDLWTLFSGKPSVRLKDISAHDVEPTTLLIPLPGSSNPFWQGDWVEFGCGESVLLKTFSRRVLDFYNISDGLPRPERPLTLTMIDRKQKRRLLDKDVYWAALNAKYPSIKMQLVDYAALPLSEQIRISHLTDILVGIHGAGLTHGMFLPPNSTLVEILPPQLEHRGFDNMAKSLGHHYFSTHGSEHDSPENNGDWQHDDIFIEQGRFMDLMEEAIASAGG